MNEPSAYSIAILQGLNRWEKAIYGGTVPYEVIQQRRKRNRAAKATFTVHEDATETYTVVGVTIEKDGEELVGIGAAKRRATEEPHPTHGVNLAVARALRDMADHIENDVWVEMEAEAEATALGDELTNACEERRKTARAVRKAAAVDPRPVVPQ